MTKDRFKNLNVHNMIYNNHKGLLLDVIEEYPDIDEKKEGIIVCYDSLRKGRIDYEKTIYEINISEHNQWEVFKRGDYDKITNHSLKNKMINYQLSNNTFIIKEICDYLNLDIGYLNILF